MIISEPIRTSWADTINFIIVVQANAIVNFLIIILILITFSNTISNILIEICSNRTFGTYFIYSEKSLDTNTNIIGINLIWWTNIYTLRKGIGISCSIRTLSTDPINPIKSIDTIALTIYIKLILLANWDASI